MTCSAVRRAGSRAISIFAANGRKESLSDALTVEAIGEFNELGNAFLECRERRPLFCECVDHFIEDRRASLRVRRTDPLNPISAREERATTAS